jgi:hypothetical protein
MLPPISSCCLSIDVPTLAAATYAATSTVSIATSGATAGLPMLV